MAIKTTPNGTADLLEENANSLHPIVGINLGNTYASIAVFTKEGVAECIANEDGERQMACAISFSGEEIYIGNQATHQLVKNSANTIIGFRNLLGKKFSEIPQSMAIKSAPVIQHPDIPDEPAYKVQILHPAPSPLPQSSTPASHTTTPAVSNVPTPRSEPVPAERVLTVAEVNTMFIQSLVKSAEDFLGKKIEGAVVTVPPFFTDTETAALENAITTAGVRVLQLLDEAAAAAVTTTSDLWHSNLHPDRTQLVIDAGYSSLSVSLISLRSGMSFILASSTTQDVGSYQIDDKLVHFFANDFTKKTKTPLSVCPATTTADERAEAKLRLAIEHTKRTISASPGAATCAVESLKDGLDYTGTINRVRFDLAARGLYVAVTDAVNALLEAAAVDAHHVDEIVYVGGTSCLPGLNERIISGCGFREEVSTPFIRGGVVVGGGVDDPSTVLSRGCAMQAALIASVPDDDAHAELRQAYARAGSKENEVKATSRTIGVMIPGAEVQSQEHGGLGLGLGLGGTWVPVIHKETALPVRRSVRFDVEVSAECKKVSYEVWEVVESVRIEKITPEKTADGSDADDDEDDDEDDEDEDIEVKHRILTKEAYLGSLEAEALLVTQKKGKVKKLTTAVEIQFILDASGGLKADLKEVGENGASAELRVPS